MTMLKRRFDIQEIRWTGQRVIHRRLFNFIYTVQLINAMFDACMYMCMDALSVGLGVARIRPSLSSGVL